MRTSSATSLPGFSAAEQAPAPSPALIRRRERERRALDVWIATGDYMAVKKAMKLPSKEAARIMVNRAEQAWASETSEELERYRAMMVSDLLEMTRLLRDGWRGRDWMAVDRALKVQERLSRLLGLDAQKDETGGIQINLVEHRFPWERGEVVEHDDGGPGAPALPASVE